MGKISKLSIINGGRVIAHVVGFDGVTEIKETTMDDERCFFFIFEVYKGKKKVAEIINCPVEIIYE